VKESLPAYCAPRQLTLVESLPRTALGKVRRKAL
jgi:O-succinylbenzoic acid--CoA ligase